MISIWTCSILCEVRIFYNASNRCDIFRSFFSHQGNYPLRTDCPFTNYLEWWKWIIPLFQTFPCRVRTITKSITYLLYIVSILVWRHRVVGYDIHLFHGFEYHIDGLLQDCSNSIANALQLLQFCTEPSVYPINHPLGYVVVKFIMALFILSVIYANLSAAWLYWHWGNCKNNIAKIDQHQYAKINNKEWTICIFIEMYHDWQNVYMLLLCSHRSCFLSRKR